MVFIHANAPSHLPSAGCRHGSFDWLCQTRRNEASTARVPSRSGSGTMEEGEIGVDLHQGTLIARGQVSMRFERNRMARRGPWSETPTNRQQGFFPYRQDATEGTRSNVSSRGTGRRPQLLAVPGNNSQ